MVSGVQWRCQQITASGGVLDSPHRHVAHPVNCELPLPLLVGTEKTQQGSADSILGQASPLQTTLRDPMEGDTCTTSPLAGPGSSSGPVAQRAPPMPECVSFCFRSHEALCREVVDAGYGQVALHNAISNRFVKMGGEPLVTLC